MERVSRIYYHLIEGSPTGVDNVVAIDPNRDNPILQADSNHPHWSAIKDGLARGDESVFDLFDVQGGLVTRLTELSDRVSFDGRNILFDGDVQTGPLADHLFRCLESGVQDYAPVVKFWEKVAQNPDQRSREQLFTWLQNCEFTITEEGDILGYKGVVTKAEGEFLSVHSGSAYVDGVEIKGQIPNNPGTVVTMPRSQVKNDPNTHCSYGLHVGDWSYASSFGRGATLEVHVNPRDVVSIPNDHSYRKMRCCKYKVVKVRETESRRPIEKYDDAEWSDVGYDPYDYDYEDDYGY
jgi:hypothetical protein